MADVTFEELLELAKQLDPSERLLLAKRLEESIPDKERNIALRKAGIADHEQLQAAGAFNHIESLFGKFATSGIEWEEDELNAYLQSAGREWEQETDELTDDSSTDG